MRTISYSAPAKIHLMGEHSVVHGKPALLAAIDKYITATLEPTKTGNEFNFDIGNGLSKKFQNTLEDAIKKETDLKNIPPYKISVSSDVPIGTGLGSSAALSAVITAVLLTHIKIYFDNTLLFKIAYEGEKFFHGNPSGGDLAVVIEGGLLYFRKEFEFLKSFSKLSFPISKSLNNFLIIDSGKPEESTKEMVAKVGVFKKESPEAAYKIFNNQEDITKDMVIALKEGNENTLINCIKDGEDKLEKLKVVSNNTQKLIDSIEAIGGCAKISGGGGFKAGSGMLLAYHPDLKILEKFCIKNNLPFETIKIVEDGIKKI